MSNKTNKQPKSFEYPRYMRDGSVKMVTAVVRTKSKSKGKAPASEEAGEE